VVFGAYHCRDEKGLSRPKLGNLATGMRKGKRSAPMTNFREIIKFLLRGM
jgi:hypothetical protein